MRASTVDNCIRERQTPPGPRRPLKDTLENAIHSPSSVVADAKSRLERAQYRTAGTYEDEHDVLLFFRDREIEFRRAITASTWLQMRVLPGVTNSVPFRSKHYSTMQAMLDSQQIRLSIMLEGKSLLGRAAEIEARRRLVLAAIALERYRLAHGFYPKELQSLVPDVLKSAPVDFMDGKPLRYRLTGNGTFVLHSVGLDCVDDGGKFSMANKGPQQYPKLDPFDRPDMVWPRAASDAEAQTFQLEQTQAKQEQIREREREVEEHVKEEEKRRQ